MNNSAARIAALVCLVAGAAQTSCEKESPRDFERGIEHLRNGENDYAIWALSVHLRKNPAHAEAFAHRGTAKRAKGDIEGALADFDRAIELKPDIPGTHLQRAIVRAHDGDAEGALADLDSAIELNPKNTDAYYYRANIRTEDGDLDGAIADYTRALQFDPAGTLNYFNRGIAHYLRGDWARARSDFDSAARLRNPQVYGLLYSCILRSRLGEETAARAELRGRLEDPADSGRDEWFGKLAGFLLGDLDQAALITAAHEGGVSQARNQLCEAWYFAGMARLFAGQEAEAAGCFRRSIGTGRRNYAEHSFAAAELASLESRTLRAPDEGGVATPAAFDGKIHRVNAASISLRNRRTGQVRVFAIQPRTPITLDGGAAATERLKPAMDATVMSRADGVAISIDATSGK